MKLVFDTNVIVDVLMMRAPFAKASKEALAVVARVGVSGAMTANTMTDIFYLLRKHQPDKEVLKKSLIDLMDYLDVLDTTRDLCRLALQSPLTDFEDALVAESAKMWSADFIISRDPRGFINSPIKAITPDELSRRFTS